MAHTSEQRDHLNTPLCGATKKNGEKCRMFAGGGTDHRGVGRCKWHLGTTKTHKQHAVKLEAAKHMAKFGWPKMNAEPHGVLLGLLRLSAGHVEWLLEQVASLDDMQEPESQGLVRLYAEWTDRAARVAKACSDVGISERRIMIEEGRAVIFAEIVDSTLKQLGIPSEQQMQIHEAIATRLEEIAVPTNADAGDDVFTLDA